MKLSIFSVDGVAYPGVNVVSLKRSFSVLDGSNAGRTMDGAMQRDIIGTYYNYSLEIASDFSSPEEYDALYEVLSSPENSHTLVIPYAQETLTFQAYVANGEDELFHIYNGLNKWDGLAINFVAMKPQRRPL